MHTDGTIKYGQVLQIAAIRNDVSFAELLFDYGANVNLQGGYWGNALQAAASHGNHEMVQLLLERNANVNAEGGTYGTALQAAAYQFYSCKSSASQMEALSIVQYLVQQYGAKVNTQNGAFGNALQAAVLSDYEGELLPLGRNNRLRYIHRIWSLEAAKFLISFGAKPQAPGPEREKVLAGLDDEEAKQLRRFQQDPENYMAEWSEALERLRKKDNGPDPEDEAPERSQKE